MRSRATVSKYATRGRITRTQKSRNVGPSPVGKGGSRYPKHAQASANVIMKQLEKQNQVTLHTVLKNKNL